jgi:hypothetical protein
MPDSERIVLQVKHDELTGKAPFVPRFPSSSTRLYSEDRVVRGYRVRLYVATSDSRLEYQDHFGVYIELEGGPSPCSVQFAFELVHYDGLQESALNRASEYSFSSSNGRGYATFISKARLASPDNNPYVKDGYLTFKCTFKIV